MNSSAKRFLLRELPIPIFAAVFSLVYFFSTNQHDLSITGYPYVIITVIVVLIILIIRTVIKVIGSCPIKDEGLGFKASNIFVIISTALCYLFLIPLLGYYSSTFLFLGILMFFFQVRKPLFLLTIPAGYVAFSYAIFRIFLHVPLPKGILF